MTHNLVEVMGNTSEHNHKLHCDKHHEKSKARNDMQAKSLKLSIRSTQNYKHLSERNETIEERKLPSTTTHDYNLQYADKHAIYAIDKYVFDIQQTS